MAQPDELYRKAAIERLASPERYDHLVTIASRARWTAVAATCVLIALALLWIFLETSP
jgi:HlyD family secretion protein